MLSVTRHNREPAMLAGGVSSVEDAVLRAEGAAQVLGHGVSAAFAAGMSRRSFTSSTGGQQETVGLDEPT